MNKLERFIAIIILFCMLGFGIFVDIPKAVAADSEFWQHSTIWASGEHFWFSIWGYKNPTGKDVSKSYEQGWWGKTVEVDTDKE